MNRDETSFIRLAILKFNSAEHAEKLLHFAAGCFDDLEEARNWDLN